MMNQLSSLELCIRNILEKVYGCLAVELFGMLAAACLFVYPLPDFGFTGLTCL